MLKKGGSVCPFQVDAGSESQLLPLASTFSIHPLASAAIPASELPQGPSPCAPTPGLGCGSHSLVVIEAMLGSQVGADRWRVLRAFADDPGFTVKADLPREGVGWDLAWPPGVGGGQMGPYETCPEYLSLGNEEGCPRVSGPSLSGSDR